MKCLVTGSSGLLGRCLVERLHERGDAVRSFDVVATETPDGARGVDESVVADMRDADALRDAARDVDVIYHLAAGQRMKPQFAGLDEQEIFDMNLGGVANVLRAAEAHATRKVVFVSSSGIYGIPRTVPCGEDHPTVPLGAYGESKLRAEILCREAIGRGLDVTVFRPMSLFGPRMSGVFVLLFEWVRRGRPVFLLGSGANRVQFVSAWDVADACIRSVETPASRGCFFNIGADPDSVPPVYEQVRALVDHAGSGSRIVRIPAGVLRNAARLLGAFGLSPIVPEHYLLADSTFVLDISSMRSVLGWSPAHDNVGLMNDAFDWYVAHGEAFRPGPHPVLRMLDLLPIGGKPARIP